MPWILAIFPAILVVIVVVGGMIAGRRRGYNVGGDLIVRCAEGHLFTSTWIRAAQLGRFRPGSRPGRNSPRSRFGKHQTQKVS